MKLCEHCGRPTTKPRSAADHRRFFGVINAAFDQWPESFEFVPDDAEHLRSWLLCKAGYRETVSIPVEGDDESVARLAVLAVEGALKAAHSHAFVRPYSHGIVVFLPKSLNWSTLGQRQFVEVREAVESEIEKVIGVKCDALLKEHENAA
jgi:hypothetical protein